MLDCDEHGVLDRDVRLLRSAARSDAAVAGTVVGTRVPGAGHRRRPESALQIGFPGRVLADLTFPVDSLLPGVVPAQDARCLAVAKRVMSAPVSAMMTSAVKVLIPGIEQISCRNP